MQNKSNAHWIPDMSRISVMTIGFLLIFSGIQLNLVESFVLTPEATKFWHEKIVDPANELVVVTDPDSGMDSRNQRSGPFQAPFFQASWAGNNAGQSSVQQHNGGAPKTLTHPQWICWPVFFAGTVFFLHGLSMRQ